MLIGSVGILLRRFWPNKFLLVFCTLEHRRGEIFFDWIDYSLRILRNEARNEFGNWIARRERRCLAASRSLRSMLAIAWQELISRLVCTSSRRDVPVFQSPQPSLSWQQHPQDNWEDFKWPVPYAHILPSATLNPNEELPKYFLSFSTTLIIT